MRVGDWKEINEKSLIKVDHSDTSVELTYDSDHRLSVKLSELVEAENGCCGAAGIELKASINENYIRVLVNTTRDGIPARTVLGAFASMCPSKTV